MKIQTMAVLAGVTAPLILSGSASGGFVGITTASKPNPFGLFTVNVYAIFDRPGEDFMLVVAGTPQNPLTIQVNDGTFYQHPFGTDRPPLRSLLGAYPSLAYDTFVTIGKKDDNGDNLILTTRWPGFRPDVLQMTAAAWAVTPNDPQGNPFDPANSFPGNGQVLIGQFSTANGTSIEGTMLLQFFSNGVVGQSVVSFKHMLDPLCPWDVGPMGGDGIVGITDFLVLLAAWGPNPGHPADFDGDGVVGIVDFLELLANWGPCP